MVAHLDRGTVKMFNTDRGFGFIIPDDGGKDLFVHANTLKMSGIQLKPGERVEYERVADNRGFQAHRVQLV